MASGVGQLVELLKQIQELAGVGVDALKGAAGEGGAPGGPPEGSPEEERGESPAQARSEPDAPSEKMAAGREGGGGGKPPWAR